MTTRILRLGLALALLAGGLAGCSSDDDPTTPPIPEIEDPLLATLVQESALLTREVIDACAGAASGQMGKADTVDPWWDEGTSCWRWSNEDGSYTDPNHTWGRGWNFAVTFYQGETPQMHLEGADRLTIEAGYHYNAYDFEDEDNNFSSTFYLNLMSETMEMDEAFISVSGSGSGQLMGAGARDGETFDFYEDLMAGVYLVVPLAGCPSGSIDLDFNPRHFSVGIPGDGHGYWEYLRGPGDLIQGSFEIPCGK